MRRKVLFTGLALVLMFTLIGSASASASKVTSIDAGGTIDDIEQGIVFPSNPLYVPSLEFPQRTWHIVRRNITGTVSGDINNGTLLTAASFVLTYSGTVDHYQNGDIRGVAKVGKNTFIVGGISRMRGFNPYTGIAEIKFKGTWSNGNTTGKLFADAFFYTDGNHLDEVAPGGTFKLIDMSDPDPPGYDFE